MMRSTGRAAVIVLVLMACSAAPARAQVDVAAGYASLHETDLNVPTGWFAAVGGELNNWLGAVAQVSGHYKTVATPDADVSTSLHIAGGGPRLRFHHQAFTPFGQVLFGAARSSAHVPDVPGTDFSSTDFAIQPAGGVDFAATPRIGVRVQIGETFISSDVWEKEFHVMAGVVFRAIH